MTSLENELRATLETPMRMRMALGHLPPLPASAAAALEAWLAEAAARPGAGKGAARFAVAVSADLRAITWRHSFAADAVPGGLAAVLEPVAGADQLALLDAALERLCPPRVGHHIEARAGQIDRGWDMTGELSLSRALAVASENPTTDAIERFAIAHRLTTCQRLGRSLGAGNPFTALVIPLPGDGPGALALGLDALAALDLAPPPASLRVALEPAARPGVALSIWITERGASRVGLVLPRPSTVDVLRICGAAGAPSVAPLAAIEGALGVDGPDALACAIGAGGVVVELEYDADARADVAR